MNRYEMEPILNPSGRFVIYGDHLNAIEKLEARIEELENLLTSVTPEKDAEGIILKAKQTLGGEPGDSLIQLCIKTEYERSRYRKALEEVIANETAYNRGDALSAYIAKTALGIPV